MLPPEDRRYVPIHWHSDRWGNAATFNKKPLRNVWNKCWHHSPGEQSTMCYVRGIQKWSATCDRVAATLENAQWNTAAKLYDAEYQHFLSNRNQSELKVAGHDFTSSKRKPPPQHNADRILKGCPGLEKQCCLLPETLPHLSTGCVRYCRSALCTSALELCCNTMHNP